MKTAIIGFSGSGKSTLARLISQHRNIPVMYMDCVHWLPGWQEIDPQEQLRIVGEFLDQNDSWVIDGNYTGTHFARRMEQADEIIFLCFNRFSCLWRVCKRYWAHKGVSRFSMTDGCDERINMEFIRWVLLEGRSKRKMDRYRKLQAQYPEKFTVLRNQRQLDAYCKRLQDCP